jgi:drug/metabolite transporter (DMT)-like permease
MTEYQFGVLLGLLVAGCWTASSLSFSAASRRIGSVPVNLIRLVVALLLLSAFSAIVRGQALPTDATRYQVLWLTLSGVAGFFIGDLTLFRAFVLIGPRRATLIMSLAPAFTAVCAWALVGERLTAMQSLGMLMTLAGVMWVIAERSNTPRAPITVTSTTPDTDTSEQALSPDRVALRKGVLLGLCGAFGQGLGAALTKLAYAHGTYDAFGSTQIRAAAAVPLFALFILATGRTGHTIRSLRNGRAMTFLSIGATAGPFLGVSMFNASIARVPSGVTSILAGMVPVFMLPIAAVALRERVGWWPSRAWPSWRWAGRDMWTYVTEDPHRSCKPVLTGETGAGHEYVHPAFSA